MKHFNLLLSLLLLSISLNAQVVIDCFPYTETFDDMTQCGTTCGNACVLSNGWVNVTSDDMDWTVNSGGTGSSSTGPSADHTTGSGNYVYTETSGSCSNSTAEMISPAIDLTGLSDFTLDFWYHMYGSNMGTLFVEVSTNNQATWTVVDNFTDDLNSWQQRTVNLNTYVGGVIFIRFRAATGSGFRSDMAIDDVTFSTTLATDIGITAITAPVNPIALGPNNVDVDVFNYGSSTITTANINWSVNGAVQTAVPWTGSIATGASASQSLGSFNFGAGFSTIRAWSSSPNGSVDAQGCNDTAEIVVCTPLAGTYTLGAGGDFTSFSDLGFALNSCGVSAPVLVDVLPGTYTDRLILNQITGASMTNTITVDGGDTSLVRLENSTFSNIYLNGTDWFTVTNMTLANTGTTDAYGVQLRDDARNNTISKCRIEMSNGTGLSDVIGVSASDTETSSFSEEANAYFTTVDSCHITGGEKGIHFEGDFGNRNTNNTFSNNLIDGAEDFGIYVDDQDFLTISGNTIQNLRSSSADGIYLFDQMMFTINENRVIAAPDYAFYLTDGNFDAVPTARGQIINNMFSSTGDAAMYLDDIEETDIWHNTAYNTGGTTGAFRINDMTDVNIQNNIFVSETDYAFESLDAITTGGNIVDYNAYWTPASNTLFVDAGPTYADLAAWQAGQPGFNANSVEANPLFANGVNDLHVLSPDVNDFGNNSLGVVTDIDGDARPAGTNVDMGADEFTPDSDNAGLLAILIGSGCGASATDVNVVIQNLGIVSINSLPITVDAVGANGATLNLTYTDTLAFGEVDTVLVGTLNTTTGGTYDLTGFVALAGDQDTSNDSITTTISANFIPLLPQANDVSVCENDTAEIIANTDYPVTYGWYDMASGGTQLSSDTSLVIPGLNATTTYYLEYLTGLANSFTTTFAGGNGAYGNMFDLTTTTNTMVTAFDINTDNTGATVVEVYYIPNNTFVGNDTDPALWTLEGTYTVLGAGDGNPTNVPLSSGIPLVAGQSTAVYVYLPGGNINYTNGGSINDNFTDGTVTFTGGFGKNVGAANSFDGLTFQPRTFNGNIYYQGAPCSSTRTPVTATLISGPSLNLGADVSVCPGSSATLDAGASPDTYNWSTGATTQTISVSTVDDYIVTVSDISTGCTARDTVALLNYTPTQPNLGPDDSFCSAASYTMDAGAGFSSYSWSTGATTQTETVSVAGTYTVTTTDANGCSATDDITLTTTASDDPSFSYSNSSYCSDLTDPAATVSGTPGGTFSAIPAGLVLNSSTGEIDLDASTAGTYDITYLTSGGVCADSSTVSITINTADVADISLAATTFCIDDADPTPTINATTGGTFSGSAGLVFNSSTGEIDLDATGPGTFDLTYTTPSTTCSRAETISITINPLDDATFSYGQMTYCTNVANPTPTITGLAGGSFSAAPAGLVINASTGEINLPASTPGTYTVTYTTNGTCINSSDVSVTVLQGDDAGFSFANTTYCLYDANPVATVTGLAGGTFSAQAGLDVGAITGKVNLINSIAGTFEVYYTTNGICPDTDTVSLTLNAVDVADISLPSMSYCADEANPTPTINATIGGVFSGSAGLVLVSTATGEIDLAATGAGTFDLSYATTGTCPDTTSVSLTITARDDASFSYAASAYCLNDMNPIAAITGTTGGSFSSSMGLALNSTTGMIDLSNSMAGTYDVIYTTAGACADSDTVSVTLNAVDVADIQLPTTSFCVGDANPIPVLGGTTGGTFSGSAGLNFVSTTTGEIDLVATSTGTYDLIYTTAGTCPDSDTVSISLSNVDVADISLAATDYCYSDPNPVPTVTGTTGGTFFGSPGLAVANSATGEVDLNATVTGTFNLIYVTTGACIAADTATLTINPFDDASFSYGSTVYCNTGSNPVATVTGLAGGTFSAGSGLVFADATTGEIDLAASTPGTYTVTYTTNGTCPNTATFSITVDDCTSIEEVNANAINVVLFPNPNTGHFYLRNDGDAAEQTLRIVDMLGQTLYEERLYWNAGQTLNMDLSAQPAGLYQVQLIRDKEVQTLSVIIRK